MVNLSTISLQFNQQYSQEDMDRILRPERLETDPNSGTAAKEWLHWKRTFDNFLAVLPQEDLDKLAVLSNFLSPQVSFNT